VAPVAPPVKFNVLPTQIGFGAAEAVTPVGTLHPIHPKATHEEVGAFHASKHWVVVLKMSKLFAGDVIASRCMVVIRGISKPLPVLCTSSMAELSGMLPVVFIATWQ